MHAPLNIPINTRISKRTWDRVIKTAIDLADTCESRCKHVSFLIYKNRIISSGINILKTDTFAYRLYKYAFVHSELNAIKKCPKKFDLEKCSLINLRVSKDQRRFIMSRPCPSCIKLIDSVGLSQVYYTDNNNNLIKL